MQGIYYLIPTLVTIAVSMLVVRAGAIALMMTGMNFEKAKFQALSAFSGTGFTTREAELVINNPRRRKIVSWLMILGNAGIVTVIVTATSSFAVINGYSAGMNVLVLVAGLILLMILIKHTPMIRYWEDFVQRHLRRFRIFEEEATVDELLHIIEGYGVVRVMLETGSPYIDTSLSEINPNLKHSLILGIEREGEWIPTPRLNRKLMTGDRLVIYGKLEDLAEHFGG